jgi:hypothetical protein
MELAMGDNGNGKKDKKSKQGSVKLQELTALRNIDSKESKDKTAVWIKNWHLAYEFELRRLQVELMKLQKSMKAQGTRLLLIFESRQRRYDQTHHRPPQPSLYPCRRTDKTQRNRADPMVLSALYQPPAVGR